MEVRQIFSSMEGFSFFVVFSVLYLDILLLPEFLISLVFLFLRDSLLFLSLQRQLYALIESLFLNNNSFSFLFLSFVCFHLCFYNLFIHSILLLIFYSCQSLHLFINQLLSLFLLLFETHLLT